MWYRDNPMNPEKIWVDRDIDGKLDGFEPCEPCSAILNARARSGATWQDLDLCRPCSIELEIQSAIDGVKGLRPYNLDREPEMLVPGSSEELDLFPDSSDQGYPEDEGR